MERAAGQLWNTLVYALDLARKDDYFYKEWQYLADYNVERVRFKADFGQDEACPVLEALDWHFCLCWDTTQAPPQALPIDLCLITLAYNQRDFTMAAAACTGIEWNIDLTDATIID